MSGFEAFLRHNTVGAKGALFAPSSRFLDDEGNPVEWEIRAACAGQDELIRRECLKRIPLPGSNGSFSVETDFDLYLGRLAAFCTVFPNLGDAALQQSYGVMGTDALLKAMLLPGEYAEYLRRVQEVNGFDVNFADEVDAAKK